MSTLEVLQEPLFPRKFPLATRDIVQAFLVQISQRSNDHFEGRSMAPMRHVVNLTRHDILLFFLRQPAWIGMLTTFVQNFTTQSATV